MKRRSKRPRILSRMRHGRRGWPNTPYRWRDAQTALTALPYLRNGTYPQSRFLPHSLADGKSRQFNNQLPAVILLGNPSFDLKPLRAKADSWSIRWRAWASASDKLRVIAPFISLAPSIDAVAKISAITRTRLSSAPLPLISPFSRRRPTSLIIVQCKQSLRRNSIEVAPLCRRRDDNFPSRFPRYGNRWSDYPPQYPNPQPNRRTMPEERLRANGFGLWIMWTKLSAVAARLR